MAFVLLTRHALKNQLPGRLFADFSEQTLSDYPLSNRLAERVRKPDEEIEDAVQAVMNQNLSIRSVGKNAGISKFLLTDLVEKHKNSPEGNFRYIRNIVNRKTFTEDQEKPEIWLKVDTPAELNGNNEAGIQWLHGFMRRHEELSLRQPESTSLSRTYNLNKTNTTTFFSNLEKLYQKHNFDGTGYMTVTKPPKVVAVRGTKQVGQIASAERGTLATFLPFINASGGTIPVFPRVYFKDNMFKEAPIGAKGMENPSSWMTEEIFVESLEHFLNHAQPTDDKRALIIIDNHAIHVDLQVVDFAREKHIIILTLPQHCSHRMKPLDVTVYGPLKSRIYH